MQEEIRDAEFLDAQIVSELPEITGGELGSGITSEKRDIINPKDVEDITPTEPDSSDH